MGSRSSLIARLNSQAASQGISGPLWFAFSQEFGLALASWLNAGDYAIVPGGSAPFGKAEPIQVTGGVSLRVQTLASVGSPFGASGPLGINTESAILGALRFFPLTLKPIGSGVGSGVGLILPTGKFTSPLGPLGGYLTSRVGTLSGPVGKSWLLGLGARLESGLALSGTAAVIGKPLPSPAAVIVSVGVVCPL
jgi:hypothetical protein